jgi:hypothetical protein
MTSIKGTEKLYIIFTAANLSCEPFLDYGTGAEEQILLKVICVRII